MNEHTDPFEHVAFLSRSETRVNLLTYLRDEGPVARRRLREELGISRSTIVRSVRALETRGWVETDDGVLRITAAGALIVDAFTELVDTIDDTTELAPFLRWFPHEEFDLDLTQLRDATVTTSMPGDPYAPARRQTELLRTATRIRVFLPSIDLEGTRVVHERILAGDLEAEILVGPDVGETIRSGEYAELFREQVQTDRLTVFVVDEPLPFYLGLSAGDDVQIGVEDANGMPQALLETDRETVRSWAVETYRMYRDRATLRSAAEF